MKKLLSALLAFTLIFSMSVSAFAAEPNTDGQKRSVESGGYTFTITEQTDENHRIIRTYEKDQTSARTMPNLQETKALLVALGMEEDNVNELSEETLQEFAEGSQITISTSYTKADENNNVTYLDETTALAESAELKAQQDSLKYNLAQGIATAADYEDYYKDSYMKVTYAVTYKGSGSYLYSIDGKWLTMPFFRGFDSIGSCAMNGTVTNSTRSGNYSYDITYINGGSISYDDYSGNITNFKNAVNGNWYGSSGIINLPNDVFTDYSSIIYDNFEAHYQYRGHVTSPSEARWFNTVASYDHATVSIAFDPSVSIDLNGDVSASIGLSIVGSTDTRSVEFEVYYKP